MPDLVNFQKELKAGHVKSGHDEERISPRGKGKEKERARKRASLEGEDGEEDGREVKKQKTEAGPVAAKARGRKSDVPPPPPEDEDEVEVVEEPKKRGRPVGKAKGATQPSELQTDGKDVVIMTTQVTLSDDQIRALTKMGVKFTTKPLECTHLVARAIVRTEKFLVAMAVAPHIVTDKWVEACVSKKKIMPEKDYILKDPDNEKRYHYKLADALSRAHKKGRKLFEGKTFYVTPKVPVDAKLLKAVITAGGGQFSSQNPTVRILKGHSSRFVVSTPADVSIWRPLAEQGFPVYSQELVLTSVLRQEVDWDDKAYFVPGSL
ncbi:hypothetical protein PHLGIDRAFT_111799 [Phlebiopsis gigantea 11061_1 CR5-6]|uniref:BRCT domain-containing protein n=1 Tax=Phlebiopsis gigantea (strain 11061_1 CR5-6) TaxID=745531 RepID=A0A0C3PC71_PHLG1|nr:hypothetical protein PHLGIDRAFT_111799 [Phlebiopsis gigantea 11061_1 CR5-6]